MTNRAFHELVWEYGEAMNDRWEDEVTRKRLEKELVEEHKKLMDRLISIEKLCWEIGDE